MNRVLSRNLVASGLILLSHHASAQTYFQNMDFEMATLRSSQEGMEVSASAAFPYWTVQGGYTYPYVLYNNQALDSGSVSILNTNYISGSPGLASGRFYVRLTGHYGGLGPISSISQYGFMYPWVKTLLINMQDPVTVTFEGIPISFSPVGPSLGPYGSSVYAGDVSAFAGQSGTLMFSRSGTFDNIRFSPDPVPEPTSFSLTVLGATALLVFRRCNHDQAHGRT